MSSRRAIESADGSMGHQGSLVSTQAPSRKRARAHNMATIGLDIIANVSEATDILAPLKAACRTIKSILEVMQAVDDNKGEFTDLAQRLEEYMLAIEDQIDSFEEYPPEDRVVDEAFRRPLIRYVETLEEFHGTIINYAHKRRSSGLSAFTAISKRTGIDTSRAH
ncbi:hypothetical protein PIIN_05082 [Serendipita indica DSM 11827]|uniref:Uncharacterized protein n=1 Tax=Serendipita indica (strain DSM 11827) TaxID=1109443 RepID=G4TIK4_SERID|nr:hypothetical protein PIIN_05082 [Serendipita indica DSM 11827]